MKLSKRILYFVEYAAIRSTLWLVRTSPTRPTVRFAETLASICFLLMGSKRRVAVDNILAAGIADTPEAARRTARASFRHFGAMLIEALKAEDQILEDNWRNSVDVVIPDDTMALLNDPKQGIIVVTAHFGSWEVAAQCLSFFKPVVAIARNMANPYADELIQNRKKSHRFRIMPKYGPFGTRLFKPLKDGHILGILSDQHPRAGGMVLNFLGRPAATHKSPARLHLMTGAPVCFAYCVRLGPMRYRFQCSNVIRRKATDDRDADQRYILETLTAAMEEVIRETPEQYLWAHRRWRVAPQEPNPAPAKA